MKRLQDKVAVITGTSSGFGRAMAIRFAEEGAKVVCSDTSLDAPYDFVDQETTHEAIKKAGGTAIYQQCNVSKESDVQALRDAAINNFGRIDIWVNNAGIYRGGVRVHETPEEYLDACYNVNVKGTWFGTQTALKQFLLQNEDKGKIINIVSSAGVGVYPSQVSYNVSKFASQAITKTAALEYGQNHINVNGICPTYCATPLVQGLVDDNSLYNMVVSKIPMAKFGEALDVANLALFLASEESNYLTGLMVLVDGGETLSSFMPVDMGV